MQRVRLSNDQILNFPQEMSQEDIKSAIQKKFPSENKPEQKTETVNTFLGNMPKNIPEFKSGSPENKNLVNNMINAFAPVPAIDAGSAAVGKVLSPVTNKIGQFGQGVKSVMTKIAPKELAYGVQRSHDFLKSKAQDIYNFVKDEAAPRGIGNLQLDKNLFDEIENLPISNTAEFKDLVSRAKNGDYEALRDLQSELGTYGHEMQGAADPSHRYIGRAVSNLRDRFNNNMYSKMSENGAEDLAKMLKEANGNYTKLHETYYKVPAIRKIVDIKKGRIIPKNAINAFSEESDRIKPFLEAHPEVKKAVDVNKNAQNFLKSLNGMKNLGLGIGAVGGGIYGVKTLKDILGSLSNIGNSGNNE